VDASLNYNTTNGTHAFFQGGSLLFRAGTSELNLNTGLNFGRAVASAARELTKHVQFHYAGYGQSVTSFRMTHVAAGDASHYFVIGTADGLSVHHTRISH